MNRIIIFIIKNIGRKLSVYLATVQSRKISRKSKQKSSVINLSSFFNSVSRFNTMNCLQKVMFFLSMFKQPFITCNVNCIFSKTILIRTRHLFNVQQVNVQEVLSILYTEVVYRLFYSIFNRFNTMDFFVFSILCYDQNSSLKVTCYFLLCTRHNSLSIECPRSLFHFYIAILTTYNWATLL